jgi:hypothetical protein|tara:strand:- start:3318 stop:3596 length:279 start_codon:yes stop_codon:yes gene_type:complete
MVKIKTKNIELEYRNPWVEVTDVPPLLTKAYVWIKSHPKKFKNIITFKRYRTRRRRLRREDRFLDLIESSLLWISLFEFLVIIFLVVIYIWT